MITDKFRDQFYCSRLASVLWPNRYLKVTTNDEVSPVRHCKQRAPLEKATLMVCCGDAAGRDALRNAYSVTTDYFSVVSNECFRVREENYSR